MAAGDIFLSRFHFENPSGRASAGLYFRETTPNGSNLDTCSDIAEGLETKLRDQLLACLSSDWEFTAISVDQVHPTATRTPISGGGANYQKALTAKVVRTMGDQTGNFNGGASEPALPAGNAVQLDLIQNTLGISRNGRFNFPGIPESQTAGPSLITAYVTICQTFADLLATVVNSPGDVGVWEPVVVSAAIRDALGAGNPKDWVSSILPITDVQVNPIIAIQRRRATKVRGGVR